MMAKLLPREIFPMTFWPQLRAGELAVRQKPGPTNALGLVKLIFPNEHSVYLHSTTSQDLFSRSHRDFSHGCIRIEKPAELAAWVLRNNPRWVLERVQQRDADLKRRCHRESREAGSRVHRLWDSAQLRER